LTKFQKENSLNLIYTQNVDGLEEKAGINRENIIFAHGRRDKSKCSKCQIEQDFKIFREHVEKGQILFCKNCSGPCKTSVVFFGEPMPKEFFDNKQVNHIYFIIDFILFK
jgi:NAD-dependent SIR2 family protein deacetylase